MWKNDTRFGTDRSLASAPIQGTESCSEHRRRTMGESRSCNPVVTGRTWINLVCSNTSHTRSPFGCICCDHLCNATLARRNMYLCLIHGQQTDKAAVNRSPLPIRHSQPHNSRSSWSLSDATSVPFCRFGRVVTVLCYPPFGVNQELMRHNGVMAISKQRPMPEHAECSVANDQRAIIVSTPTRGRKRS